MNDRDSAMCSALTNQDKNHFYFCYPDLAPKAGGTRACKNCGNMCLQDFCGNDCSQKHAKEAANKTTYLSTFKQYRFATL